MTTFGKSIRIYLKDGTVSGIKFGEVVNQTIQAVACPRSRTSELNSFEEIKRPGVYFLFGEDENTGDPKVYIGEAENVQVRIQDHIAHKDFWNEVVFFVSKDDNLTKSHVKYLESRLIEISNSTKRYLIENSKQSSLARLPMSDRDAMEEFIVYIRLLIGVLGHKLLEVSALPSLKTSQDSTSLTGLTESNEVITMSSNLELFLQVGSISAKAVQTDEGIVVLANSEAAKEIQASLSSGYRRKREELLTRGILKLERDKYIFTRNQLFSTTTPAAAIILGYNLAGPQIWKDSSGRSYKKIEEERLVENT